MKRTGPVGRMTPESTTAYYQLLVNLGRGWWGDPLHDAAVLIDSIDLAEALFSAAAAVD